MIIVAIAFVILLVIGMPVVFAIAISGLLFFFQHPELPRSIPLQLTISQTQNFALLAVPMFIIAGNLMNRSGITEKLLDLASILTGRLRGGLAQVSIALSALIGGVSGSAIADAAMQSRVLGGEMIKRGLAPGFAAGVLCFSSILTPIIPPGIGMILYGTVGQVSIGQMFAAGFFPAMCLGVGLSVSVWITAKRRGYMPERTHAPTGTEIKQALKGGFWALMFPVILLFGLRTGVFTPSEIGAAAVVYAFIIGILVYRKLNGRGFVEAIDQSLGDVGAVVFLVAVSAIFGYGIVLERIPQLISDGIVGVTDNLSAVMVLIVIFTVIAGLVVDATVLIIMLTPIFLPLIKALGGDPVHFGIVFIIAATIGNFTPPIGAAMYTVCSILNVRIGTYTIESLPLALTVVLITVLLVFLPQVVLFLPTLMFR